MARNIFIGAILAGCVNFFLLKTGWHTWEIFTKQADQFAEDIRQGSRRLSPFNLWRSITADPNENSPIHYFPGIKKPVIFLSKVKD